VVQHYMQSSDDSHMTMFGECFTRVQSSSWSFKASTLLIQICHESFQNERSCSDCPQLGMLLAVQLLQGALADKMLNVSAGQVVRGAEVQLNAPPVLGSYPAQSRSDDSDLD